VAKLYSLKSEARIPEDIITICVRDKVRTARVEAIGGVKELRLAYFNHLTKRYEEHEYHEFLEVTSLLGNVTLKDGKPFLHAHGNFGRKDQSVVGGHIVSATAFPILEVVVTPTKNTALRRFDEDVGLNVIYRA
jgi:hypothetical protein